MLVLTVKKLKIQQPLSFSFALGLINGLFCRKRAKESWWHKETSSFEDWQVKSSDKRMVGLRRSRNLVGLVEFLFGVSSVDGSVACFGS